MKKRILLFTLMLALFVCLFVVSANAETVLKSQDNNAYGELSFFDESISVGRTNTNYNFTPYIDAEGTTYARVVIGDGTTFYTFPTAYILSESTIYYSADKSNNVYVQDFSSLNTAMETATGTNPGWGETNVYRIELPAGTKTLNGDSQNFQGYTNVVEIFLQPNSGIKDKNKTMAFWGCNNLETIYNLDTFVFRDGCLGGAFQNCSKLTNITIGVSSEVTTTGSSTFSGCAALESVNFAEAFPNLTTIGKEVFKNCTSLVSTSSTTGTVGTVTLPNKLTSVGQYAFQSCSLIKTVSLPTSLTKIDACAFNSCTALQFVEFGDNQNTFTMPNWGVFYNCTSLQAISLPAKTQSIPDRCFSKCTNLKAVYMGEEITAICGNKGDGDDDGPAFASCTNLYFVQEPFSVTKEDGSFYSADEFEMPEKPNVYYFPSTLVRICNTGNRNSSHTMDENGMVTNTGADDLAFVKCYNLNTYLVFPEGFTGFDDISNSLNDEQRGDTMGSGFMHNCATKDNPVTLVFLGRIDRLSMDRKSGYTKYMTYMFANSANTSFENTKIGTWYNTSDSSYSNQDEMYVIFCHAENGAQKYRINFEGSDDDAKMPVLKTTLQEDISSAQLHVSSPILSQTVSSATCIKNAFKSLYCFCGYDMGTQEISNTATGIHVYDDDFNCATSDKCIADADCTKATEALVHKVIETLVYGSYLEGGIYNSCCENAGCNVDKAENQTTGAIFVAGADKGYSTNGTGIAFGGYSININALKEFNRVNKNAPLTFGIMLINPNYLDGKTHFMQNGIVNTDRGALQVEMSDTEYSNISIMVNGFTGNAADLSLVIALYAYTDADDVEFIQSADTKCASAKVTKTDGVLYTVNYKSVSEGLSDLSSLGEYVVPSKEEDIA